MTQRDQPFETWLLTWPVRRRLSSTLLILLAITVSIMLISRLQIDTRLESMLATDSPSADALKHVLNDFRGTDELIVLVEFDEAASGLSARERAGRLTAFGRRLQAVISDDVRSSDLVVSANIDAGDEADRFAREVIAPNAAYYLDQNAFNEFKTRLTPEGIREQVARNARMIASPQAATGVAGRMMLEDPLHLYELLAPEMSRMRPPFKTWKDQGAFISSDASALLVRVVGKESAGNSDFAERLMNVVPEWVSTADPAGLRVSFTGAYAIADHSRREIRSDLIGCLTGSAVLIALLLISIYRKPWLLMLAMLPVAAGVLFAFGVYALLTTRVSPVTASIGGILAGLSIDYAVHYISHYEVARFGGADVEASVKLDHGMLYGLLGAAGTSVLAFGAISISSVDLLRSFAMLGAIGLACALVATLWVLPTALAWLDRRRLVSLPSAGARVDVGRVVPWLDCHRRVAWVTASVGLICALVVGFSAFSSSWIDSDVSAMHPQPNPPLAAQKRVSQLFSTSPETLIVHLQAESPTELSRRLRDLHRRFEQSDVATHVTGVFSPATLLPHVGDERLKQLESIDRQQVLRDLHDALDESIFSPDAFEPYFQYIDAMLANQTPADIELLLDYPQLAGSMLPVDSLEAGRSPLQAIAVVSINTTLADSAVRSAIIGDLTAATSEMPGVALTGIPVAGYELERSVRRELPIIVGCASLLVFAWGVWCLRGIKTLVLSLLPVAFAIVCLLAFMQAVGLRFNLINMLGLPILVGVTIDAGMFLTRIAETGQPGKSESTSLHERLAASVRAISICGATTILGFGSLMFSHTPAIQSLGVMLVAGMIASVVGSLFLLVPILLWRAGPAAGESAG